MTVSAIATNPATGGPNLPAEIANGFSWPIGLVGYGVDGQTGNFTLVGQTLGLPVQIVDSNKASYVWSSQAFTFASAATDILQIQGSSTKTVKIAKIRLSGIASSVTVLDIALIKRSTAASGGTPTTQTALPLNSSNAAATAVVTTFAGATTAGTPVGTIVSDKLFLSTSTTQPGIIEWNFETAGLQAFTLNGTSQYACLNVGAVTIAGNSLDFTVFFTEE